MKFQQIRSATSIVTFANRRFLIDPMLSAQGTYPAVPDTTSTGRGNPDCDLPCPIQDLFNVDAVIVTHLHFDHFDKAAGELLPKNFRCFLRAFRRQRFSVVWALRTYAFLQIPVRISTAFVFFVPIVIMAQAIL